MKLPFPGQATYGSIGRSGVEVNDVVIQVGGASQDSNYFYNINKGIYGTRATVTVVNNKFFNIITDSLYTDPWDGSAICSVGDSSLPRAGHLTVQPLTSTATTIESSYQGIHTEYSDLDAQQIEMVDMYTGIYSTGCTDLLSSYVYACEIEARELGINWLSNNGSASMLAEGNSIYVTGQSTVGISMRENSTAATANYEILGNYVKVDGGDAGIMGQTLWRAYIDNNVVKMLNTPLHNMAGIILNANESSDVTCNTISGDDDADTLKQGVRVDISNNCHVICNHTDSTGFGIFFGCVCAGTDFRGNTIDDHFDGLRLNKFAVIDTQTHAGNHWIGNYGNFGAMNLNAASQLTLGLSLFRVNPTPDATLLPTTSTGSAA